MQRVTILMAVLNGMPHIKETIDSIESQILEDWRCVIVDDGCNDGTPEFLDRIDDPRFHIITQHNMGLAAALNRGLEAIETEYVARIDSDDTAMPERLIQQLSFLDNHPEVGMVGTQAVWRTDNGEGGSLQLPVKHNDIMRSLKNGQHAITHSTIMFRTAEVRALGGYWDEGISEDWDLFLRMGERTQLANIDVVLNRIRIADRSLTGENLLEARSRISYACALARRRQIGLDPIAFEEYMAPWWRRLRLRINTAARVEYRLAVVDGLEGRIVQAALRMGLAALGAPRTAFFRLGRMIKSRLRQFTGA